MATRRYVWRDDGFYDRFTGERMEVPARGEIAAPIVVSDIPEYRSPIDGKLITSRSHRREDLARNGCVDARDVPSATGGKFKNRRFCDKRGLQVSEEFR